MKRYIFDVFDNHKEIQRFIDFTTKDIQLKGFKIEDVKISRGNNGWNSILISYETEMKKEAQIALQELFMTASFDKSNLFKSIESYEIIKKAIK